MSKKGMNTVLMVVVTAVVLLMTALTLIFITQGGLGNFLQSILGESGRGICISNRDNYCSTHGSGCWNSTEVIHRNQTCTTILGKEDKPYYDCEDENFTDIDHIEGNCGTVME